VQGKGEKDVRDKPIQQPHQPQDPPERRVPPDAVPAEDQSHVEGRAVHLRREQDEHRRACVVRELQQHDLLDDLERGQVRQGPRAARRGAPAWWGHGLCFFLLLRSCRCLWSLVLRFWPLERSGTGTSMVAEGQGGGKVGGLYTVSRKCMYGEGGGYGVPDGELI